MSRTADRGTTGRGTQRLTALARFIAPGALADVVGIRCRAGRHGTGPDGDVEPGRQIDG